MNGTIQKARHLAASAVAAAAALLLAATPAPATAQESNPYAEDNGYGYFRTVEGISRLTTFDKAEPIEIEVNYPVLVGDRVYVTPGARLEALLPDRTVLRADGGTDLFFEELALSADAEPGAATRIRLLAGELQLVVTGAVQTPEPPRIDTLNATVYLQDAGTYRVGVEEWGLTEVVVRQGFAEVVTERGSSVVRSGEASRAEGRSNAVVRVAAAGPIEGIEAWGARLDGYAVAGPSARQVDPSLAYAAAPLDQHGDWVPVDTAYAWRPRVATHWRPYSDGWWVYTPSGLTWVASAPWGWVTSHYGAWSLHPIHGWIWTPGRVYSPAWVFWYWGPTHVAWVPYGYYGHHYGPRFGFDFGFRFGVYGWAGGSWDHFSYWTFCPVRYFGRRHYGAYWRSGHDLRHYGGFREVPRGLVLSDTRPIDPSRWGKPTEIADALRYAVRRDGSAGDLAQLRDVSRFVARENDLDGATREAIFDVRRAGPAPDRGAALRGRDVAWTPDRRPVTRSVTRVDTGSDRGLERSAVRGAERSVDFGAVERRDLGRGEPGGRSAQPTESWRTERPLAPGEAPERGRATPSWTIDPAVERGTRIEAYRQPTARQPLVDLPSAPDRGAIRRELPATPSGGGWTSLPGRSAVEPPMPPSGRSFETYVRPPAAAVPDAGSGRMPVVRRILDSVRSSPRAPEAGAPSPTPRRIEPSPDPRSSGRSSASPPSSSGRSSSMSSGSSSRMRSGASSSGRSRSSKSGRSSGRSSKRRPPA